MAAEKVNSLFNLFCLSRRQIALSTVLAFISSVFDGLCFSLLIPVFRGLLNSTFHSLYQIPFLGETLSRNDVYIHSHKIVVFTVLLLVIFSSGILKSIFQYFSNLVMSLEVAQGTHLLRMKIFSRYLRFGKLYHDKKNAGDLHQMLMNYTEQIAWSLCAFSSALLAILTSGIYLLLMMKISVILTLFVLSVFPLIQFVMNIIIKKILASSHDFTETFKHLGGRISNSLNCFALIKSYCNEEKELERFNVISHKLFRHKFSIQKKSIFIGPFQESVIFFMMLLIVGLMAFLYIRLNQGDVATYLIFFILLKKLSNNSSVISSFWGTVTGVRGQIVEISKIMNDEDKYIVSDGSQEFSGIKESIEVVNLNFNYPDREINLRNLNLSFKSNQMTALVGESGSGKTTLINLIMRFYDPPEKSILIDGVDIRSFSLKSLRSKIALVDQRDLLMNGSLRFNLVYGLERDVQDSELVEVVDKSQLSKLVESLPQGLETNIGDRGVQLSGGEKQRLQIARAMLKNAEIMIFDEATSALDSQTEQLIQSAIANLLKGKTSIVIAHRLSTIKEASNIVLIKNGEVLEQGTFNELMEKKKCFYRHWIDQGLMVN